MATARPACRACQEAWPRQCSCRLRDASEADAVGAIEQRLNPVVIDLEKADGFCRKHAAIWYQVVEGNPLQQVQAGEPIGDLFGVGTSFRSGNALHQHRAAGGRLRHGCLSWYHAFSDQLGAQRLSGQASIELSWHILTPLGRNVASWPPPGQPGP